MCQGLCDGGFPDEQGPIPSLKNSSSRGEDTDTLKENHGVVVTFHFIVVKERPILK